VGEGQPQLEALLDCRAERAPERFRLGLVFVKSCDLLSSIFYRNEEMKKIPPERIEIPDDTLVLDEVWCDEVLGCTNRRTAKRFEAGGLPYVMIGGRKYRPINEGRRWLASRIQRTERRNKRTKDKDKTQIAGPPV
jgi:hypothetical protein